MLDWPKIASLPWKARRAAVEAAAREYLTGHSGAFGTRELAALLYPGHKLDGHWNAIASELSKIAKYLGSPWVTHDGEEFKAYGRTNRRWRWHGQAVEAPEGSQEWNDSFTGD